MTDADPPVRLAGPADVRAAFGTIAGAAREVAVIAYVDDDRQVLGLRCVRGTTGAVPLSPRVVAGDALALDAAGVVIAHNHPSGDAGPSGADLALARRLARGLDAIEVRLIDLIVFAGAQTTSLRANGLL